MLARSPTAEGDEPGSNERWVGSVTGLFQSFEKARAQAEASRQWEVAIIGRIQAVAEQIDRRRGEHAEPCSGVHLLPPCVHAQLQDDDKDALRKLGRARRKRKARSIRVRSTSADLQLGRDYYFSYYDYYFYYFYYYYYYYYQLLAERDPHTRDSQMMAEDVEQALSCGHADI